MARRSIEICGIAFARKDEVVAHVRKIMARYRDDERLNGADYQFMVALLQQHRLAAQKIGVGIDYLTVREVLPWRNRCFYIVRTDGSDVEFSFMECIYPTPHKRRFDNACRAAVRQQIEEFVSESFSDGKRPTCALTGVVLSVTFYNVDHEPPFRDLVQRFIDEHDVDVDGVVIGGDRDHEMRDYFEDAELREKFSLFHRTHARLRLTTPQANLRRKRVTLA